MKRQPFRKVTRILFTFLTAGCLFLSSCGLEQFYEITPPVLGSKVPETTSDPSARICVFKTSDYKNSLETSLRIDGTSLYYRIYGDLRTMESHRTAIQESNIEHTENGYNKLISYQFKSIQQSVPSGEKDKTVTLRLYDESGFPAELSYREDGADSEIPLKAPLRYNDGTFTFTELYKPSASNDSDTYGVSSTTTTWYVPVYAVTTGVAADLGQHFSQIVDLGYFTIELKQF